MELLQVGLLGAAPTGRRLPAPLGQVQGQVQGQLHACPVAELASLLLQWLLQSEECKQNQTTCLELTAYSFVWWSNHI